MYFGLSILLFIYLSGTLHIASLAASADSGQPNPCAHMYEKIGLGNPENHGDSFAYSSIKNNLLALGISKKKIDAIIRSNPPESLRMLEIALEKIVTGKAVTRDEAADVGNLLHAAQIHGILNFHFTKPKNLNSIHDVGILHTTEFNKRVYAFPYYPNDPVKASMTDVGNGVVIFQGQAASLFSGRIPKGALSLLNRLLSHQTTRLGRMVIEDSELVDGALVIKKARIQSTGTIEDLKGLGVDLLDLYPTAMVGSMVIYIVRDREEHKSHK